MIEIEGLSYTYPDGTRALEGVSLRVNRGEKVGIIGANGAGKSTLILHFNGLLFGEGKVVVDGTPVNRKTVREVRRKVGLVFQNPDDQLFCPTLYDDVAFGLVNMGLSGDEVEMRVKESLRKMGLEGLERKSAHHLSFGQKKRAALAAVLAMQPKILVLDEPTSILDPKGVREAVELLGEIGGTQIIVSHDLVNLPKMAERVVLMAGGKVIAEGGVESILGDEGLLKEAGMI